MAAQEHNGGGSPSLNPTSVEHSLDDVARGLASGAISRGKALRWMGGALVGAAVASIPGVAWAAPGENSACAHFCRDTFPPGPERAECISAAAQGQGLCFECGPKATDTTRVLCGQVCCASGETCSATGQCSAPISACSEPVPSQPSEICGRSPSGTPEEGRDCVCRALAEGGGFCGTGAGSECSSKGCNSNAECPAGTVCRRTLPSEEPRPGFAGSCASTCETGDAEAACA